MYQTVYYDYKTRICYLRDDVRGLLKIPHQPTYYRRIYEQQEGAYPVLTGGWAVPCSTYSENDDVLEKDISGNRVLRDNCEFCCETIL
jgi:hypothetical protein